MASSKRDSAILHNVALLLERRGITSAHEAEAALTKSYDEVNMTATASNVHVKLVPEAVKNINRIPSIMQFIQTDPGTKHILIVQNIFCQPFKTLMNMDNVEVFRYFELQNDLFSNELIPEHRILNKKEVDTLIEEYNIKAKEISKMDKVDFVARYLGMKVGDWVEIKRPSITSGVAIAYRIVANCQWEKLFA